MAASDLGVGRKGSPCIMGIAPGETKVLAEMEGPGVIQHIWITVADRTEKDYFVLRDLVLRMYWDDEEFPSVESPLGDFFCCGFARDCVVNSAPIVVVPSRGFNCYFPMPFRKKARITIENQHKVEIPAFFYRWTTHCMMSLLMMWHYFHAQWNRRTNYRVEERLYNSGRSQGKGTLRRYVYGTCHIGTLLVGRRRDQNVSRWRYGIPDDLRNRYGGLFLEAPGVLHPSKMA